MQYIINIYGNEKTSVIYLAHVPVYGVKAYARLSRVFYDAGDKIISTLVTTRNKT